MNKNMHIIWFEDLRIEDVPQVGGKNAALGEMYVNLKPLGVNVPNGFAITASAYRYFLEHAGLNKKITALLKDLNVKNITELQRRGRIIRQLIVNAALPEDLREEVFDAYRKLGKLYFANPDVAIRSSATAEDLPGASFAGQQETYLNVRGNAALEQAVKKCFASLFTDRAISYRVDKGFAHEAVALSVGIQKMVRSDIGASGVAFTLDTESGFDKVVIINSIFGLGEMIVQGKITPDEFIVFKPTLEKGFRSIIAKNLGKKNMKLVYGATGTKQVPIPPKKQMQFSLSDDEVLRLADWCIKIERHFSQKYGKFQPMDIEWAKDGKLNELFIVQARPETVHALADKTVWYEYQLKGKGKILATGTAVGTKIASGISRIIRHPRLIKEFQKGEVLVTEMTDPDWEPIMKIASAIVTDKGGRTSHAAIVSRELGIPCIVGTGDATKRISNGKTVTVDCSSGAIGTVYEGKIPFDIITHRLDKIPETKTKIMVNIGSPDEAFRYHYLPVKGVGLGRIEFIIAEHIKIHPNALIDYKKIKDYALKTKINALTRGYKDKTQFYIDELAEGIAKIGAAFSPHEVIIRFSDFKTNEYRALLGGELYEPEEENPMLGWRGASRYYDPKFTAAFGLECKAIKRVRDEFGLNNIAAMVPFCRTPEEGEKVVKIMAENGLDRQKDPTLKIYVMCEVPSNVTLAEQFLEIFDGMSIGSNDLTQLVMGLDRDSGIVSHIANENNPALKHMIALVIKKCREAGKYIGICGQAPSDYPEFTEFLITEGIESISLNPDTVIRMIGRIAEKENKLNIPNR